MRGVAVIFPVHSLWVYVAVAVGLGFNHRRLQRQAVLKHMSESSEQWLALSPVARLQVNLTVARGVSVREVELAPLAVARARMRQAQAAHFRGWRVVVFYAIAVAVAALLLVLAASQGNGWWLVLGALALLSLVPDAVGRRSRPDRLRRAEASNLRLCPGV